MTALMVALLSGLSILFTPVLKVGNSVIENTSLNNNKKKKKKKKKKIRK